ncbi:hypothetical protein PLICRDRAFT_699365 [Plicaturopsis crispa FD-325 SS-3]|nr:hypothetical protein PLICRDRAFT_699365 [Plicaturopsis crispa FD-325 SS-3]
MRGAGMLLYTFSTILWSIVSARSLPQAVLSANTTTQTDNSNLIFASLHSLLRSWSQAFADKGHAVVPATIRPGTLLYHTGLADAGPPTKGFEWFAFDAEHSYIFSWMERALETHTMWTFTATRPLRVLYFDGFSAAKSNGGTLDLQDVIAYGDANKGPGGWLDIGRAKGLCEWAKQYGIEGFVREEATFELLWCDFREGVATVAATNVSYASPQDFPLDHAGVQGPIEMELADTPRNEYRGQAKWSMYHAASWHHTVPEKRVIPHPEHLVSFYSPVYTSLAANNALPRRKHRLLDLSREDIATWHAELGQAFGDWNAGRSSGADWSAIAQAVVDRYGDRLAEMRHVLEEGATPGANATALVSRVRLIAFALAMPYVDAPTVLVDTARTVESLAKANYKCTYAFTGHFGGLQLTPQERGLKHAVEGVLDRLCGFATGVLGNALDILSAGDAVDANTAISRWRSDLEVLMAWLGWAMWERCDPSCAWDEQCYIPMWPLVKHMDPLRLSLNGDTRLSHLYRRSSMSSRGFDHGLDTIPDDEDLVPRCLRMSEFP